MPIHVTTSTTQSLSNKTFVDRVSTTGIVHASGGTSDQWNSAYSNLQSNSATWVTTVSALSSGVYNFALNSDGSFSIPNNTINTGSNAIQLFSSDSSSITWRGPGGPGTDVYSQAKASSGAITFTLLKGAFPVIDSTKVFTLSSDGGFIFPDSTIQSTAFTGSAVDTQVRSLTSNWQSTYSTVQTNSAQWATDSTTDTGVRALTANWQNTYTGFSTQSANNASVYSSFNAQSANNASVYSTVQTSSSTWGTGSSSYIPATYTRWAFTGSPPTSAFSIPGATSSETAAYRVTVDFLLQDPSSYTINNVSDVITFSEAPPLSSTIIVIEETFSQVTAGDGAKWNSTYSTVNTNSATWAAPTRVGVLTGLTTTGLISSNYVGNTDSSIIIAGINTKGGAGYHDFLRVTNGGAGVTNPNKYFRLNNTGNLEIINSAYTSNILTLGDTGNFSVGGNIQVNGKQAVNGPAFAAYAAGILQTIPNETQTKVLFQTEEFDTANCYSNSTFTPNVEGYYQLNAEVRLDGASGTGEMMIILYKNGSEYKRGTNQKGVQIATNFWAMTVSSIAYANGTTDYFEIYVQQGSGSSVTVTAVNSSAITWFNGCMLRGA